MRKKQIRYLKTLQWAIVVVIFAFLGKTVWDNWRQVKDASFTFEVFPLLLSTLLFAFSYFIQIGAWYLITLKLKIALSPSETLKTWFYSQLGKYLPGKVWIFLGRFHFYELEGKSKRAISIALYFETITVIVAAGIISFVTLLFFEKTDLVYSGMPFWWMIFPLIFIFIFLHPKVLQKILNWVLLRFKRESISLSISYPDILWVLLLCILSWLIGGAGFYLFIDSFFPIPSIHILYLMGALAFSSTLGLIALFAPSGLGVREGALVYLLSFIIPGPVAVIISVLTRIWITLIEIGLTGMVYLMGRLQKDEKKGVEIA
jgi:uncharacterized membrane protein YbhN (UPF0104 family)